MRRSAWLGVVDAAEVEVVEVTEVTEAEAMAA